MRFRRIEKDGGGVANVGLKDQHIQGKEDDVTTSDSKTYIGSKGKQKLAMNKIKNTKVGDDIHYYINGTEGRGIVIKMGNEFLQVFGENQKVNDIHINDTFFVKDILINKQWDDMDDIERYDALTKIHAPSPRYITKQWDDIPEEIKVLLQKQMPGGTGSTYEKGESKDSETQDHSRTGFAQNEQYSSKKPKGCNCGDPKCKDPKCKKHTDSKKCNVCDEYITKVSVCPHCGKNPNYEPDWVDPETGTVDRNEHHFRYVREKKEKKTGKMELGHPEYYNKEKNPHWTTPNKAGKLPVHPLDGGFAPHSSEEKHRKNRRILGAVSDDEFHKKHEAYTKRRSEDEQKKKLERETSSGTTHQPPKIEEKKPEAKPEPAAPKKDKPSGGFVTEEDYDNGEKKKAYYINKKNPRPSPRTGHGSYGTTQSEEGQAAQQKFSDTTSSAAGALGVDFGTPTATSKAEPGKKTRPSPRTSHGSYGTTQSESGQAVQANQRAATSSAASALGVDFGTATGSTKAYEVWLERRQEWRDKSDDFRKLKPVYEGDTKQSEIGSKDKSTNILGEQVGNPDDKDPKKPKKTASDWIDEHRGGKRKKKPKEGGHEPRQPETGHDALPKKDKSDVEHGRYGSVGGTPNVAVSTDTKVDVTTGTGYEERPHISVEEAGKLPRGTFNESGSELTVSGSQDSKDEPKFSQPASQEQPVRKAGIPQQHPNTYGMRYGMKGGVKKVWCPEHQMWEETRKDWHEEE